MAKSTKQIAGEEAVHYVPPRKKRERPKAAMQPPMTPMIDVTFQLIIFFLVGFQMRETEGLIPSALPQGDIGKSAEPEIFKKVFIRVQAQGDLKDRAVYQIKETLIQTTDPEELRVYLEGQKQSQNSDKVPVVIQADGDVQWEFIVEAFNAAVRAKLKNVAFASSDSI
ncbi:MAG: biopolymer transporter ExbD [Planctomycetaceae bacterium]|nr:biopolymer transporter ExbD [Planctomycetaceae bacterium]